MSIGKKWSWSTRGTIVWFLATIIGAILVVVATFFWLTDRSDSLCNRIVVAGALGAFFGTVAWLFWDETRG